MLIVNNAEAPAYWSIYWLQPWLCGYNTDPDQGPIFLGTELYDGISWYEYESVDSLITNYYPNSTIYAFDCFTPGGLAPASTRFAINGNLPQTLTLGSQIPFTTTYGMPVLSIYNKNDQFVEQITATSVNANYSAATFPFPSTLQTSGYSLAVSNQIAGVNQYQTVGTNLLSIASSLPLSGNPFGVAVAGQTLAYNDLSTCNGKKTTSSGSEYITVPVISFYSLNEVLINSTYVTVGSNPTVVVSYPSGQIGTTSTNGCVTAHNAYTGNTRGIVANSGSNTVSILDLANKDVIITITVGNKPVAIAVNASGTTAFVANYKDGTISEINLSTDTVAATLSVGANPNSLALTSGGTLWVGGPGYLSEINTSTMTVTATEAMSSKSIIALGYTDMENKLVATTVDTSGNVYADEISPSSFTSGGVYTPLASNTISTLGNYTNTTTHAEVKAYTSTLSNSTTISANQVGAAPLIVQDGWAAVEATPTGFSIIDTANNIVLVSETTPSPVTAIAVDTKLNVAYLTLPDSNTVLYVPLPGVN